jgi:hypothetical protein
MIEMAHKKRPISKLKLLTPKDCNSFSRYYPFGIMEIAQYDQIHPKAMDKFEGYSRRFILPENYHKGDFHQFFIVQRTNQEKTYVAYQTKTYPLETGGNTERLIYLFELNQKEEKLGHGEIRFNVTSLDEFFVNKPFEGFTQTEPRLQKEGRGTDRLLLCNALTQTILGLPYYSDVFTPNHIKKSEGPWKMQLIAGNAVKFAYKDGWRYHFK